MDLGRLAIAIGVPWLLGIVWVRYRWERTSPGAWATLAGYGFVAGMLVTTLTMRLIDLLGFRQDFWVTSLILSSLAGLGLWLGRDSPWRVWRQSEDSIAGEAKPEPWERRAFSVVVAILVARLMGLGLEMMARPLFAWDAWATWAPKARVWWELKRLVPFVDWADWVDQSPVVAYTLAGHHYPPTIPLLQLWSSLALDRWDDSLINVTWLVAAVALGLAFYGQTRLLGVRPLPAILCCYLLLSLPLLDTQLALAGTADVWMASIYGLAAMACFHWLRSGDRRQGVLALGLALACSQIKVPGLVWMLTFVPALLVPHLSRRRLAQLAAAFAVATALWLTSGGLSLRLPGAHPFELTLEALHLPYLGNYSIGFHPGVLAAFAECAFSLASWHLFWYAWPLVVLWRARFLLQDRAFAFLSVLALTAFAFVGGSYLLTPLAAFALDFTQVNRATLHMTPMLLFMAVALLQAKPADPSKPATRTEQPVS